MAEELISTEFGIIEEIKKLDIDAKTKEKILANIKLKDDTIATLRKTIESYKSESDRSNMKALIYKNAMIELIRDSID